MGAQRVKIVKNREISAFKKLISPKIKEVFIFIPSRNKKIPVTTLKKLISKNVFIFILSLNQATRSACGSRNKCLAVAVFLLFLTTPPAIRNKFLQKI